MMVLCGRWVQVIDQASEIEPHEDAHFAICRTVRILDRSVGAFSSQIPNHRRGLRGDDNVFDARPHARGRRRGGGKRRTALDN